MQILTTAVSKGGTAKATTCAAIAQVAADTWHKVLVIDLDSQMNLTEYNRRNRVFMPSLLVRT